ncbi:RKM4 (YDR257C) [Zygosaccharomyces parabailii]|uniref:Ribosomal lysine N-methyltransferase 4 n=1 Tax=Zygosaccharomyces bailii (strain CLIB 213 / ATCC 58445 / CBS 680 / BCRC 21525 / NBRC 1098 / NCYC 1416 / NRRL Y-2227) TaxID=1333698 RepID=A0A8J2T6N4_ZYGB2|nr:RKM4 (YDR257C) [Zygosaccharomyces parabailii]CDF89146.1 ZYBA0S03-10242g1_1 [Zygosaccharomyces bailii CLIB 213]CDH16233.1 related to Ribosomal N-lysine methyltransferase 4 [Zygosaccharomyces bailii ISA1307]
MASFNEATEAFYRWVASDARIRVSPKVYVGDLRDVNQGRCVLASQDIGVDEVLFEIPRSSILNVSTSQLVCDFPQLKDAFWKELGHWEGLVLCILYEIKVMGPRSFWWHYLRVLPEPHSLNTLVYWETDELAALEPSLVVQRLGIEQSKEMYQGILHQIKAFGPDFLNKMGSFSFEEFVYVASIIMSYSFDVEIAGREEMEEEDNEGESNVAHDGYMKSMIPLADTLNSDTKQYNAHLVYDEETLKMCCVKPIAAGQQIYNFYGEHPNAELLRRYGYVEWDGSKYDFGELQLSDIKEVVQQHSSDTEVVDSILHMLQNNQDISEILEDEEVVLESYDCYVDGNVIPECLLLLQTLCAVLQLPDRGKDLERKFPKVLKRCLKLVQSGRITMSCLRLFEHCIEYRLRQYPNHSFREVTPIHQYVQEVHTQRRIMAQRVLLSEVESLQNCYLAIGTHFEIVDDMKLLDGILKKRTAPQVPHRDHVKKRKH